MYTIQWCDYTWEDAVKRFTNTHKKHNVWERGTLRGWEHETVPNRKIHSKLVCISFFLRPSYAAGFIYTWTFFSGCVRICSCVCVSVGMLVIKWEIWDVKTVFCPMFCLIRNEFSTLTDWRCSPDTHFIVSVWEMRMSKKKPTTTTTTLYKFSEIGIGYDRDTSSLCKKINCFL